MTNLTDFSDDEVADAITAWAGRIAAGEARLLRLIGEFDRREAWSRPGLLSCAHWLSWITARTLPPHLTGQRLDLDYAVAVLMQQAA